MSTIPEPPETGTSGTQEASKEALVPEVVNPFDDLPIVTTVKGIAAVKPKGLGGEISTALIAGSFVQMSSDLQEARKEIKELKEELKEKQSKLSEAEKKATICEDRLETNSKSKLIRYTVITIAPILIAIGIELLQKDFANAAFGAIVIGIILLLMGWFAPTRGAGK